MKLNHQAFILRPFSRVALTAALALAAGCGGPLTKAPPSQEAPPSIILIVVDTLRADFLGTYGFDGPISPHLDQLADQSVLFERCSSQAPWTTASMASMMTSLYPEAHGVRLAPDDPRDQQSWRERWTRAIPDSTTTLAELLSGQGYRTAAFIANPFLARGLGFEQGFDSFDETAALERDRDASMLLHKASKWLRSVDSADEPTFLYLHLMDVHGPYAAPEADYEAVRNSAGLGAAVTLPRWGFQRIQPYLKAPKWAKGRGQKELRLWRGRYAAGVHAVDRRLGGFIQELRDEGLWDNQLVVVTSDHGEELFDHGGWDHGFSLHGHQLHVPLIVRFPDAHHGGVRTDRLVRLVDIMPTLIDMAGAENPTGTIGSDFRPLIDPPDDETTPRFAFATSVKSHPGMISIFDGRYKLIANPSTKRLSLYDIVDDPGELRDISADNPEIVQLLTPILTRENSRVTPGDTNDSDPGEIPPKQLERLRELGYLQ